MRDPNNPWHPWQLRPAGAGNGQEILRHNGWMVWGNVHAGANETEIRTAIEQAAAARAKWLAARGRTT